MTVRHQYPDVEALTNELFGKIERSQGYAFVSDGETFPTTREFFERIRGRLEHQREGVKIMAAFLRKHGELHGARRNS